MRLLSIDKEINHHSINIDTIKASNIANILTFDNYDYIIIHGGDGGLRRVLKQFTTVDNLPPIILNPTGSFNVIAKMHKVPKLDTLLQELERDELPKTQEQNIYKLNDEIFLFSAGNMGDLQHIFLSETLRFGILEKGISKYALSLLFLFPIHLFITPFMLLSKRRFFIFTPFGFIKKFGSFYGKVEEITIQLENGHNLIELDGDVVTVEESKLSIQYLRRISIVSTKE